MSPRTIIERAIEILHTRGWTQNTIQRDETGEVCLEGALGYAAYNKCCYFTDMADALGSDEEKGLARAVARRTTALDFRTIQRWNDAPERTLDQVLDLLKDVYAELPL